MEAAFHEANIHFINEEYDEAITLYTTAISLHPDRSHLQSLQNRAAAFMKLRRYYESLDVRFYYLITYLRFANLLRKCLF